MALLLLEHGEFSCPCLWRVMTTVRNADMDDPDEPPMLSYGDLYSRLGGMQGSR